MKIGIIGLGTVGNACKFGFEKLGHEVLCHDIKLGTCISNVLSGDIVFICVPTPIGSSGECDISIVENVIEELNSARYTGVVAIKSTVVPGTTKRLQWNNGGLNICFVPEFLRERCAIADFVENHILLAVGTSNKRTFDIVKEAHGRYPKNSVMMGVTESEFLKYYSNVINALRVGFANEFFETCTKLGASYDEIKNAYILTGQMPDQYLDVNENFRGYSGVCLPKDVKAIIALQKKLGLDLGLFKSLDEENQKYKKTVPSGMRLQ